MTTLTKINRATWSGNKLGTTGATWAVRGAEHVHVFVAGGLWIAVNTKTNARTSSQSRAGLLSKIA